MSDRRLILTCVLSGVQDGPQVADLLRQYGLHTSTLGSEVIAHGDVPEVLCAMRCLDIEAHLLGRIQDAAPGATVAEIRAVIVSGSIN